MPQQNFPTLLIEQSTLLREGLGQILNGSQFRPVGAVSDVDELSERAFEGHAGLLCLVGMRDRGLVRRTAMRLRHVADGSPRLVVLTSTVDVGDIRFLLACGARGILLNSISSETLIKSLELVALGEMVISSPCLHAAMAARGPAGLLESAMLVPPAASQGVGLAPSACGEASGETGDQAELETVPRRLSQRETTILEHLTRGSSNKIIAGRLEISEATVKVHVKAILRKIRVRNRTQAAMWAVQNLPAGIAALDPPLAAGDRPTGRANGHLHETGPIDGLALPG